jgi:hypothetical protein
MCITCASHVHHMCITCASHVHHMCITCASACPKNSHSTPLTVSAAASVKFDSGRCCAGRRLAGRRGEALPRNAAKGPIQFAPEWVWGPHVGDLEFH